MVCFQRGQQQTFPEAAWPAEETIPPRCDHPVYNIRLVDIYITIIPEAFKILYSDGVYCISNLYIP